jgi:hypothetical protein
MKLPAVRIAARETLLAAVAEGFPIDLVKKRMWQRHVPPIVWRDEISDLQITIDDDGPWDFHLKSSSFRHPAHRSSLTGPLSETRPHDPEETCSSRREGDEVRRQPEALEPELKKIGGSQSDDLNLVMANQAINTLWLAHSDDEFQERQKSATLAVLVGIRPKDETEGMIAGQLLAAHKATMECYRRAMIPEQSLESRCGNLNQANKLSRTYTNLLEALNRHRGNGQQKVTVEHVHVHSGGQEVVGTVENPGGGERAKSKDQPHAKQIAHAPQPPMWGENAGRDPLSVSRDAERSVPHARGKVARRSKGKP